MIPFNKPYLTGRETYFIEDAVKSGKISGNGIYTQKCQQFFENRYGIEKCLMTTSCTDALEMCALLLDLKEGDEIIVPSYTFVSSALAFVREGAHIVFADSQENHPNIEVQKIEKLINSKTKAIVVVHYAGVACDMEALLNLVQQYGIYLIEDAAQAIESFYTFRNGQQKALGSIGHFSTFSFHETKNIISGEGGMLGINSKEFIERSEIIWEKGTNRSQFFKGDVNKYGWVDTGSSFLPSEIISAFLWAQLEKINDIQSQRIAIWNRYHSQLEKLPQLFDISLPQLPEYATNNAHMYYLVTPNQGERDALIQKLRNENIYAVFHYLSLHKSDFYKTKYKGEELPNADKFTEGLIRLPLYFELTEEQQDHIIETLLQ